MFKYILIVAVLTGCGYWYYSHRELPSQATPVADSGGAESTPPAAAPSVGTASPTVDELLRQNHFSEADALLEQVAVERRDRSWKTGKLAVAEGLGRNEEVLRLLDDLEAQAQVDEKSRLLWSRAESLRTLGREVEAEAVYLGLMKDYPGMEEAFKSALLLQKKWRLWLGKRDYDERMPELAKVLTYVYENSMDEEVQDEMLGLIDKTWARILANPKGYEGLLVFHDVKYGEFLSVIAKKYEVYSERIQRINGIENSNMLRAGQRLKILKGRCRIVVDKERFRLAIYLQDILFKHYKVGIGKDGKTPRITTAVSSSLAKEPPYSDPKTHEILPFGHPGNPIGTRWIGFTMGQGYGIHGTNQPETIGTESSNGCIRLKNSDVEDLYDYVMKGDEVVIR
ncbi:MAG: L,D-transpeptidase family protein [Planctomycetes bacterium]|nr:L,D-transpeptidase family protein [Planctomycetota bacterium]